MTSCVVYQGSNKFLCPICGLKICMLLLYTALKDICDPKSNLSVGISVHARPKNSVSAGQAAA